MTAAHTRSSARLERTYCAEGTSAQDQPADGRGAGRCRLLALPAAGGGRCLAAAARHRSIAWLLTRPTVSSVIIGARNEAQLQDNLAAVGWSFTPDQIKRLEGASTVMPAYPYYPSPIRSWAGLASAHNFSTQGL